jgi:hypothetical protein
LAPGRWLSKCSDFAIQQAFQKVPMAMLLFLRAMAKECDVPPFSQFLQKAQGEFLAVIPDGPIIPVNPAVFK